MKRRREKDGESADDGPSLPSVRPSEQLLLDAMPDVLGTNILCNTAGRAQFAFGAVAALPDRKVSCWVLDSYQKQQIELHGQPHPAGLSIVCEPDFPAGPFDTVAMAFHKSGEAELARELMQTAHLRLADQGRFVATVDHAEDQWVHAELCKLFPKVTRRPFRKRGVTYLATKTDALKKVKNYHCEFAFRDLGRLIFVQSRPGVFSHRHIDPGARALINTMQLKPGMSVVDLGCGSGTVALAAAARTDKIKVLAVDSNPRAVEAVLWGQTRNELTGISAVLDPDGSQVPEGTFDMVLANPPYFSNFRIAELFLKTSVKALRKGGTLLLVTKSPAWYEEKIPELFRKFTIEEAKEYFVVRATKG